MKKSNGDVNRIWQINTVIDGLPTDAPDSVRGLGSFHKTLPHNKYGEVDPAAFAMLVSATRGDGSEFSQIPTGPARPVTTMSQGDCEEAGYSRPAQFTNPQAGLSSDRLVSSPSEYTMPPAPSVFSSTAAAEMLSPY